MGAEEQFGNYGRLKKKTEKKEKSFFVRVRRVGDRGSVRVRHACLAKRLSCRLCCPPPLETRDVKMQNMEPGERYSSLYLRRFASIFLTELRDSFIFINILTARLQILLEDG